MNLKMKLSYPDTDAIVPPPAGYIIKQVRDWKDSIMNSYGYDISRGGWNAGQFQVVTAYVTGRGKDEPVDAERWVGQWSAITNYNKLNNRHMLNLAKMQLLEHGYKYDEISDEMLLSMRDLVLPDGYTVNRKMGWLDQGVRVGVTIMWNIDGKDWDTTNEACYGAMVNGGQLVAVSEKTYNFFVKMPSRNFSESVTMRRLLTFSESDWGKSHKEYPYLSQWATVANMGNEYGEYIRGHVLCPVALSPSFDFAGTFIQKYCYLPDIWLK